PTTDDLDYHLSTLFPPVRPRGYLEVRYLDAQPGRAWLTPVAVLAALFADPTTVAEVTATCLPVADRWGDAARHGLADPALSRVAATVLGLALRHLDRTGLPTDRRTEISDDLRRRIAAAERGHR
ncbi:glutamate-cysteine ligase family protein, partial [Micromonospora echinofusca]